MLRTVESKIRLKAVIIYIIVAAICGGTIFYIYNLQESIDTYKSNIEVYYEGIAQVDSLVNFINHTQEEANQYVTTRRLVHLRQFRENLKAIEVQLDSLGRQEETHFTDEILSEISVLFKEKGTVISQLNRQFTMEERPDSIIERLSTYEPLVQADSIVITTVTQDTTLHITPPSRKNIFQRIFTSASNEPDTLVSVSTVFTDSLLIINQPVDTIPFLSEISTYTEQLRQDYRDRIHTIQNQVNRLLIADQKISSRISGLLLDLYGDSIRSILLRIEEEEAEVRHIHSLSVIAGVISLVLILLFIILLFNDVNQGMRSRRALEEANRRIRDTMESRHRLLLSVSHDIKTPLNSILGNLEQADAHKGWDEQITGTMRNAGAYILSLLNNLLEFSGLEQGTLQASLTRFNLYGLCMEIQDICISLAHAKGLRYRTLLTFDHRLTVASDSLKIKQILLNILSNAIKYTREGQVSLQVDYREETIFITVEDTGIGIAQDQLERLFEPFIRLEDHTSIAEGTGVGMFVVKGLTELLNGCIEVESECGKGTKVRILIPAVEAAPETEVSCQRILLIDDDPAFLRLMMDMVSRLGHDATGCFSVEEFEQRLKEGIRYDKVITDMEMGAVTGTDVLQMVRKYAMDMPVFVMTGRGDFSLPIVTGLGFDGYLAKPVSTGDLRLMLGLAATREPSGPEGLEELFGDDKEAIREILDSFVESTLLYIGELQEAIDEDDFDHAQRICHKMLPMFMQINRLATVVALLQEMDCRRDKPATDFSRWKQEVEEIIRQAGELVMLYC